MSKTQGGQGLQVTMKCVTKYHQYACIITVTVQYVCKDQHQYHNDCIKVFN